ncbi:hypothetical protein IZ6_14990 [Terrihabitans soli]|uniref:Uncharacterized protein n=1 Tax=Terrihabitans soli TaxID=708113 RepID=A0A6S6QK97_9HYPH|nr:hypothetical protein [Terrihabitans soli]BCJ90764.1 hypothetical protein IZ6_14990 [Terrihabitans soli]
MSFDRVLREAVRALPVLINVLAWLGVVIIAYGTVAALTGETWQPLERHLLKIAATLTLVAVLLQALLAYLPVRPSASGAGGRYTVAPAIILLSVGGLFLIWYRGLPVPVVLGLAVLALAWSLSRAVPADSLAEPSRERLL